MAKKFEVYGLPWGDKMGIDVTDCETSEEVIQKAGINFQVEKCELVARMPFSLRGDNTVNETMGDFAYNGNIYRDCPNGFPVCWMFWIWTQSFYHSKTSYYYFCWRRPD